MPFPNFIEKLKEFPVVNSAFNTSSDIYNAVKSSNSVVEATFNTAEATIKNAAYIAAPLAEKFKDPIRHVDQTMTFGLTKLEEKIPIVKDQPAEIMEKTKDFVIPKIENITTMASSSASCLKGTANNVLKSPIGKCAMETLDITSSMTDRAIDLAFPPREGEEQIHPHSNEYCEDKVYHVVHTVGTIGIKAGRKVCSAVSRRNYSRSNSSPAMYSEASYEPPEYSEIQPSSELDYMMLKFLMVVIYWGDELEQNQFY